MGLDYPKHPAVAIPLRGYVVCNMSLMALGTALLLALVAIPLRGYVVCNLYCDNCRSTGNVRVAIPLRGYVVCNPGG